MTEPNPRKVKMKPVKAWAIVARRNQEVSKIFGTLPQIRTNRKEAEAFINREQYPKKDWQVVPVLITEIRKK